MSAGIRQVGATRRCTGTGCVIRTALGVATLLASGCERRGEAPPSAVVVYTALDREFSEPILQDFERETGIRVLAVYDVESTKSVGLANRIRAERARPRCDVFWNNEVIHTIRLQEEGLLRPTYPASAQHYSEEYRDPEGFWYGFAARARVLLVNTEKLGDRPAPTGMSDLVRPEWRNEIGIAKPVAGTTATHLACLFEVVGRERTEDWFRALWANGLHVLSGNKAAAERVGDGSLTVAWTDTDDAMIEIRAGKPVRMVFPDDSADAAGTLFIPNTLAAVRGSPNPEGADRLMDYLLRPEVEGRLAAGPSAQIPLARGGQAIHPVLGPGDVKPMAVDFRRAAAHWSAVQEFVRATVTP